jgi:hypothetical protein
MLLTILVCSVIALASIRCDARAMSLPSIAQTTPSEEHSSANQLETIANKNNCLLQSERIEDCQDHVIDAQLPIKVISCLNNCANCVRQWRSGVYNGRTCALDCMQQANDNLESLDPDCSLMKYFNSTILESVGTR